MKNTFTLIVLLLSSTFSLFSQNEDHKWFDESISFEERADLLIKAMTLEEKAAQFLNETPAIPRLGVPEYNWWNESLHGIARNGKATIFPQGIAMGATFNPALIQEMTTAISDEARAKFKILAGKGIIFDRIMIQL